MSTADPIPQAVYRAAWRAAAEAQAGRPIDLSDAEQDRIADQVMGPGHLAAVASAYRAGRERAVADILAHADTYAPASGNAHQRHLRRHLHMAARVATPILTVAEVKAALRASLRGQ